jgi:anti-sigma factor ChrR (cupin superfamily)
MLVNADFTRRVNVTPDQHRWVISPQGGVERVMLDRIGAEQARATSIVRYAAGSYFPSHRHPGGEEILVLSGIFSDGDGDYPAGWYLRNPPGSSHQPFSHEGATIFVKLWQMPPDDDNQVRIDTSDSMKWHRQDDREVCLLFSSDTERVSLERLAPNDVFLDDTAGGAELLVLAGELMIEGQIYPQDSWIRLPVGDHPQFIASPQGATFYLKTGHLAQMTAEPSACIPRA